MTEIEAACAQYLPLLWPVRQLGAAVEHNEVILSFLSLIVGNPLGLCVNQIDDLLSGSKKS